MLMLTFLLGKKKNIIVIATLLLAVLCMIVSDGKTTLCDVYPGDNLSNINLAAPGLMATSVQQIKACCSPPGITLCKTTNIIGMQNMHGSRGSYYCLLQFTHSLTSFASLCCCSFFFFFLSFFLSLPWADFPPTAAAFPCRGFPTESRPVLVVVFPGSEVSESESESIWSKAKREAVVGTVIIADDAIAKRKLRDNKRQRTIQCGKLDAGYNGVSFQRQPVISRKHHDIWSKSVI